MRDVAIGNRSALRSGKRRDLRGRGSRVGRQDLRTRSISLAISVVPLAESTPSTAPKRGE
jgi:hypothetical protein